MKITLQRIDVREQSKDKKIEDLEIGDFNITMELVHRCVYLCYENDQRHKILKNRFGEARVILSNAKGLPPAEDNKTALNQE